ncbi:hypothetical protein [Hoeflea sp.]|uniref:hypothetical protein n=1 Tax=Hoeflea sp. TaxID=1940281 RepID=UPI00199D85E6|nr:hypothetical protein [Hoeflea sp.]MBC7279999.1 hypothetical protein [Hoeflea sp.]
MQVNRYLKDKAMDRIDHALGRPVDPMGESYRNHYAADAGGEIAASMRASPHWREGRTDWDMTFFFVTPAGRSALRDHLRAIGDRTRLYLVSWHGHDMTVPASSPAKARYTRYLHVSDCDADLSFKEFQADARVRLAPDTRRWSDGG